MQAQKAFHRSDRWQALAKAGANPQRFLWNITGSKLSLLQLQFHLESFSQLDGAIALSSDILEQLEQIESVQLTSEDLDGSKQTMVNLKQAGFSLEAIATQIVEQKMARSQIAFDRLLQTLEHKKKQKC